MRLSKQESREVRTGRVNERISSPAHRKDADLVGLLLERHLELKAEEPVKARACFELAGELVLSEGTRCVGKPKRVWHDPLGGPEEAAALARAEQEARVERIGGMAA